MKTIKRAMVMVLALLALAVQANAWEMYGGVRDTDTLSQAAARLSKQGLSCDSRFVGHIENHPELKYKSWSREAENSDRIVVVNVYYVGDDVVGVLAQNMYKDSQLAGGYYSKAQGRLAKKYGTPNLSEEDSGLYWISGKNIVKLASQSHRSDSGIVTFDVTVAYYTFRMSKIIFE